MVPPANHPESAIHDLDWFNYFDINIHQDHQPLFSDDILEHSEKLHELVFDQNISPLKQDHINGFHSFVSFEDLSLWGDGLPLLSNNDNTTSGGVSDDHLGLQETDHNEDLSLWDCWDECLQFVSINDDSSECHGEATGSSGGATTDDGGRKVAKRMRPVELEEIEKCFEMPIVMAAKELRIGLTVLKKRCRDFNIKRWPHRKLKSLQSLIQNVKELGLEQEEIKMLEGHKKMMEKLPNLQFTERTKKLRQACFKANYKKRRLNYP